jgi:glycosyltransferase involved in cell wall biosynthesis
MGSSTSPSSVSYRRSCDLRALVLISGLATGGAERVTVSFMRRLKTLGIQAAVCTVTGRHDSRLAAELRDARVVRHDLGARRLADPRAAVRLGRLLTREHVDVVHAHGQDASILAAAVRPFARVPLVVTRHVLEEPSATWRQRVRARLACSAFRRADAVVAVSAAAADRLAEIARLPRTSIQVIANGIELELFDSPISDVVAARRALGAHGAERLVLVPAVLRAGKGHEVLLEAMPPLLARVPTTRVLIVGGGEREPELRARARDLGEAVRFLGPREDVPLLLAACDLVVLPSLSEALPTALMEAAAVGRAVVATRVGGVPEVVQDGRTGLLVPANDAQALAEAMAALLGDAERSRAFGAAARKLAWERFGIEQQVRHTLELWSGLAARRRG